MSTVLWANLLVDGKVECDSSDLAALFQRADKLDAIARKLGLGSFLEICDTTDVRFNAGEFDLPAGVTSTDEVMAVQGAWLAVDQAVKLLDGLLAHVQQQKTRFGLLSNAHADVVSELGEALAYARSATAPDSCFNFSIVT